MKFFFDNCLSPKLAKAIHALVEPQDSVIHLRQMFKQDAADVEWIEELGRQKNWVIVSGDLRIRLKPQERSVLKAAGLTTFFMAKGFENVLIWDQARWLIEKWPNIRQQAEIAKVGSAFLVPKTGKRLDPVTV